LGAAVGVTAGILLAPKSGKETREDIARNAKKATEAVSETQKKPLTRYLKLPKSCGYN